MVIHAAFITKRGGRQNILNRSWGRESENATKTMNELWVLNGQHAESQDGRCERDNRAASNLIARLKPAVALDQARGAEADRRASRKRSRQSNLFAPLGRKMNNGEP
jgi:hypothetical protein